MAFINLADIEEKELIPGFHVRFVHSENMTFAYWNIDAGSALPEHSHPHEQVFNITEGELELIIDGEAQIMKPGQAAVIPGNVPHSGKAITDCKVIDVFYPVREDYK
ncbi:MAG: cupin domain-containing protein [Candidatus Aminicenantes bacterium]|nr:MAG: cupin domain-containing protein [Candidatus Aminicenantes bacterium]